MSGRGQPPGMQPPACNPCRACSRGDLRSPLGCVQASAWTTGSTILLCCLAVSSALLRARTWNFPKV